MGISEWAFLILTKQDLDTVLQVIETHNRYCTEGQLEAETLSVAGLISYRSRVYLYGHTSGGRSATDAFLAKSLGGHRYLGPFRKPDGWQEAPVIWHRSSDNITVDEVWKATGL